MPTSPISFVARVLPVLLQGPLGGQPPVPRAPTDAQQRCVPSPRVPPHDLEWGAATSCSNRTCWTCIARVMPARNWCKSVEMTSGGLDRECWEWYFGSVGLRNCRCRRRVRVHAHKGQFILMVMLLKSIATLHKGVWTRRNRRISWAYILESICIFPYYFQIFKIKIF